MNNLIKRLLRKHASTDLPVWDSMVRDFPDTTALLQTSWTA